MKNQNVFDIFVSLDSDNVWRCLEILVKIKEFEAADSDILFIKLLSSDKYRLLVSY